MRSLSSFGLLSLNPMRTRLASIYIRLVAFPIPCLILRISLRPFTPRHIEAILRLARLYSLWRPKQTGSTTTISKSCTHPVRHTVLARFWTCSYCNRDTNQAQIGTAPSAHSTHSFDQFQFMNSNLFKTCDLGKEGKDCSKLGKEGKDCFLHL